MRHNYINSRPSSRVSVHTTTPSSSSRPYGDETPSAALPYAPTFSALSASMERMALSPRPGPSRTSNNPPIDKLPPEIFQENIVAQLSNKDWRNFSEVSKEIRPQVLNSPIPHVSINSEKKFRQMLESESREKIKRIALQENLTTAENLARIAEFMPHVRVGTTVSVSSKEKFLQLLDNPTRWQLTNLKLEGGRWLWNVTPDEFKEFLNGLPYLEKLEVNEGGINSLTIDVFNTAIENMPSGIVDLNLALKRDAGVRTPPALQHLQSLPHLRHLRLENLQSYNQLADSLPRNLKSLKLPRLLAHLQNITPAECEKLMTTQRNLKIFEIDVLTSEEYHAILINISDSIEDFTIHMYGDRDTIYLEDEALQNLNRLRRLKKFETNANINNPTLLIAHLPRQIEDLNFQWFRLRHPTLVQSLQERCPRAALEI
jgi:hypothetical protein